MNWPLLNHNWRSRNIGGDPTPPTGGAATEIFSSNAGANFGQNIRGMIAAGTNGKVMVSAGGSKNKPVFFSSNHGQTWTQKSWNFPSLPNDNNTFISDLKYDEPRNTWYISAIDLDPNRITVFAYSENDGDTWVEFTMGTITAHGLGIHIEPNGDRVASGRTAANQGAIFKTGKSTKLDGQATTYFDVIRVGDRYFTRGTSGGSAPSQYVSEVDSDFEDADLQEYGNWSITTYNSNRFSQSSRQRAFLPVSAAGTTISAKRLEPETDVADHTLVPSTSWTFPISVLHGDIGYADGAGFVLAAHMSAGGGGDRLYVYYSSDGVVWNDEPLQFTLPGTGIETTHRMELHYDSDGYWYACYVERTSNEITVVRFRVGQDPVYTEPENNPLLAEIRRLAPDIFYRLDDADGVTSVVDVGRKNYTNAVTQAIDFGVEGLVSDGGTAALFSSGNIAAAVTQGAAAHLHLLVMRHNNTAAVRPLVAFGSAFSLSLTADHKPSFAAGSSTVASTGAIAANTTTLVMVLLEAVPCGTEVSIYVGGSRVANGVIPISAPQSASLVLSGNGVTVDYYAMIQNTLVDVSRIQEAFGLTPTAPAAQSGTRCIAPSLLLRANDAPQRADYYSPFAARWLESSGLVNAATGNRDTVWPLDAGNAFRDAVDGKFGGSLRVPAGTYPHIYLAPIPRWLGLPVSQIGTKDFTFALWVKPEAYRANLFTAEVFYRRPGSPFWRRSLGFAWQITGDSGGSTARFTMGRSLEAAKASSNLDGSAMVANFTGLPALSLSQYRFVTVSRRGQQWFASINGVQADNVSFVGNPGAPFVWDFNFLPGLYFGARSTALDGNRDLAFETTAMRMDDIAFIVGEALYTQDFTPPTAEFSLG